MKTSTMEDVLSKVKERLPKVGNGGTTGLLISVLKYIFMLIGIVSVIMIIYSGLQLVISAGDTAKVTKAKNTIIYSVIGLAVAILAYAIVNFVVVRFFVD